MVAPHKYTDEEIALIISERAKGSSFRAIGKLIGMSNNAVRDMLVRKQIQVGKGRKKPKPKTYEESDNLWTIIKSNPLALAIAKKEKVADGFNGLLVYQSGGNSVRPKVTIFECEKNPGAVPGKRQPGGNYDEHTT